jgi:hypothetical protein
MLLTIIDTTGAQAETLAMFKVASVTTRPGGMLRAVCTNDRTAETLAAFLTGHETRFVHSGPEIIIDLDSSDFDFTTQEPAPVYAVGNTEIATDLFAALAMELAGFVNMDARLCAARSIARAGYRALPGFGEPSAAKLARLAGLPEGITLSRRQVFPPASDEIAASMREQAENAFADDDTTAED